MSDNPKIGPEKRRLAICVFCGSSYGDNPAFAAAAKELGAAIAAHGHSLVFGGGNIGLMGEVARAARDGGASIKGILPASLRYLEPPLSSREETIIVPDLQSRKAQMMAAADAFVVLPGGLGTFDEYFEVLTSAQLGLSAKPLVLVDLDGFFAPLRALVAHAIRHGFAKAEVEALQLYVASPEAAIDAINRYVPAP
jgi:uncharacterized protein (TIGR00730 family)